MGQFSKPWKDLNFCDNFIFCKVMKDERLCKKMIEILLGISVSKLEYIETEKTIESFYESRGIRMDVYVKDSDKIYDLEMQTGNYEDLLLRARYYQSASDLATTKRRTEFKNIKETYIIFLCKDDPFGSQIPVYTKKTCFAEDETLTYDDKSHVIFYNSSAWEKAHGELRDVLHFIYEFKTDSKYTEELSNCALYAKASVLWRNEYMTVQDIIEEEKEIARETGLAEGREEGRAEGAR